PSPNETDSQREQSGSKGGQDQLCSMPVPGRRLLEDEDEVVAMDDLVVECRAEGRSGLVGVQAADGAGVGGGIIAQAAGELLAGGVANSDDVAFVEFADNIDNADSQQALAARLDRAAGAGVDDVMAAGPGRQADPALAGAVGLAVGQEERAHRLTGEDAGQGVGPRSRGDDNRSAGLGHQPGGGKLALHSAGAQGAPARA